MKAGKNFLSTLVLVGVIAFLGSVPSGYGQPKKLIPKPFPKPPKAISVWKIARFWTEPGCYTKLPHRDNTIMVKAIFQCRGPRETTCKELTIKAYWDSSIEHVVKKINLTRAVIDTCGAGATTCTVIWDGEKMDVKIVPKSKKISISKVGFISPRLTGNIKLALEAYTGVKLTDKKTIIVKPCGEQPAQGRPDLVVENFKVPEVVTVKPPNKNADVRISLRIKNAGRANARKSYADVIFKSRLRGGIAHRSRAHVPALNPGETYPITVFGRLPEGNYRVCAMADSTNVVAESNEGNNKTCRSLSVRR